MKRYYLIFTGLLVSLFFMTSCEKIGKKGSIFGKWEVIKLEGFVYNGDVLVSQDTYDSELFMLEFKDDGTVRAYFDPDDLSIFEDSDWTHTTDPVEEGDIIIIDGSEVTIESLTERSLVFTFWESVTDKLVYTLRKVD